MPVAGNVYDYDEENSSTARAPIPILNEVERRINELVESINKDLPVNARTNTIAEHTKSIITRTTAESRTALHDLFDALQKMDTSLRENDERLRREIDKHVGFTLTTRKATEGVIEQLKEWQKQPSLDD